jgi:signal transduction histidine kinase
VIGEYERRARAERKAMDFQLEFPADLQPLLGDRGRVRQILAGLLSNAYHYTEEYGRITISASATQDQIQVDVRDTGIGIPLAEQRRVFERFYRGEHSVVLATPGTGLGLSIVQQLVEMHRGRIWLESSGVPGEGSVVSFVLPVFQTEDSKMATR